MIALLNSIPEWMLALLGVLLLLIAALYVWILFNWLALRQRVFELVEQNEQLKRTLAAQAPVEQLYEDARQDARRPPSVRAVGLMSQPVAVREAERDTARDAGRVTARTAELEEAQAAKQAAQTASRVLQNQLDQTRSQLAQTHRAVQLRQVALDEAHRRLITYEGTIATMQADLQTALRQAEATSRAVPSAVVLEQSEPVDVDLPVDSQDGNEVDFDQQVQETVHIAAPGDVAVPPAAVPVIDLSAELDAATHLIAARDAQVAELEAQLAELHVQLDQAEDEANRAGLQWDEQHASQADVEPAVPDAAHAIAVAPLWAPDAGPDMTQQAAQVAADLELVQDALNLAQAAVQQRDATIDELKTHLGNVRTSLEMTREALQAREMEVAQLKAAPAELEQRLAALQNELGGYQQAAERANFVLAERITTISELNRELDAQETQLSDALTSLDAQNATIADLLSDVKAANETVSLQQSQYDNMSAQMAELQIRADAAGTETADADAARAAEVAALEASRSELEQRLQAAQDMHRELSDQVGSVRARVAELEAQLQQSQAEAEAANAKLTSRSKRIDTLKAQLEAAQAGLSAQAGPAPGASSPPPAELPIGTRTNGLDEMDMSAAGTAPAAAPAAAPVGRGFGRRKAEAEVASAPDQDALTDIVGIGAIHARRLNEAGISTYKALSKTKRSQLEKIIQPTKLQNIDFDSWIEQAKAKARAAKR